MKILNDDEWIKTYKPKPAPRPGKGFDFGQGCTLLSYYDAEDKKYIEDCDLNTIWTIVDDGETVAATPGIRMVNHMGLIVTEKPWTNEMIEVIFDYD